MDHLKDSTEPLIVRSLHNKAGRMKLPVNVTFELTSRCNFNCRMCYIHDAECGGEPELSAEQWIDIARQAKEAGALFVLLTGGEPLLRKDFGEIYGAMAQMGFVLSVNTNLSLLSEQTLSLFDRFRPNRVNVSLYGADDDTYAALCGVPAYGAVSANIAALRQRGIPVRINASVTKENLANADRILQFCKDNSLPLKTTAYMFPSARLGYRRDRLPPRTVAEYRAAADRRLLTAEEFAERTRRILEGVAVAQDRDCPEDETQGSGIRCRAGSSSAWIDWRGNMSYCGMVPADGANNVLNLGFGECWRQTVATAAKVRMPVKCLSCPYRHFCHICAASQLCETGGTDAPPPYICEISAHTPQAYRALCDPAPEIRGQSDER